MQFPLSVLFFEGHQVVKMKFFFGLNALQVQGRKELKVF